MTRLKIAKCAKKETHRTGYTETNKSPSTLYFSSDTRKGCMSLFKISLQTSGFVQGS